MSRNERAHTGSEQPVTQKSLHTLHKLLMKFCAVNSSSPLKTAGLISDRTIFTEINIKNKTLADLIWGRGMCGFCELLLYVERFGLTTRVDDHPEATSYTLDKKNLEAIFQHCKEVVLWKDRLHPGDATEIAKRTFRPLRSWGKIPAPKFTCQDDWSVYCLKVGYCLGLVCLFGEHIAQGTCQARAWVVDLAKLA